MSGFSNAVIGGMQKLIRAAIQSPNYQAGVAGWTVNKDGSAEFNNAEFRGTTVIGVAPNVQLVLEALAGQGTIDFDWNDAAFRDAVIQGLLRGAGNSRYTDLQIASGWLASDPNGIVTIDMLSGSPDGSQKATLSAVVGLALLQLTALGLTVNAPQIILQPGTEVNILGGLAVDGKATVGNYYEEVDPSAQVIPTGGSSVTTLAGLSAVHLVGTSAFDLPSGSWTCPEDGVYTFCLSIAYEAWVNGSAPRLYLSNLATLIGGPQNNSGAMTLTARRFVVAGTTVLFQVGQNTGAAQTVDPTAGRTFISVTREVNG